MIRDQQFADLPNGIRLHFATAGERGNPLIVFAHGFPEFWAAWESCMARLATQFFAVAPDLRGFNLSSMPLDIEAYRARHIAEDLRQLITHLGYQQCVLVAHDWGGAVAWNLAISHPQYLKRLIVLNSPHPFLFMKALREQAEQQAASAYMNWLRADGAESALTQDDFARLDGFFSGAGQSDPTWYDDVTRARYHACWQRGLTGALNYYRASPLHPGEGGPHAVNLPALDPDAFKVRVPVRVIWGERDVALRPGLLEGLEYFVADLGITRLAHAGHWLVHEAAEQVESLIERYAQETLSD